MTPQQIQQQVRKDGLVPTDLLLDAVLCKLDPDLPVQSDAGSHTMRRQHSPMVRGHSVVYGLFRYETLPPVDPESHAVVSAQGEVLRLPPRFEVVRFSEGRDFQDLVRNVVAKFGWGTHVLVVANGDGSFRTLHTRNYTTPGKVHERACQWFQVLPSDPGAPPNTTFRFVSGSGRLLIRSL